MNSEKKNRKAVLFVALVFSMHMVMFSGISMAQAGSVEDGIDQVEREIAELKIQKEALEKSTSYDASTQLENIESQLVGKWNQKAELTNMQFAQNLDELRSNDADFASSYDSIASIIKSDSITESQWNILFDDLDVALEKMGERQLSAEQRDELRQIISSDRNHDDVIRQMSPHVQSQFPPIHFMTASNNSCRTPADYMPYHYQPTSDIEAGNGLEKTYAKMFDGSIHGKNLSGKCIVEVTHIYYDEDHPTLDLVYDLIRSGQFDRGNTDIETYFLVVNKSNGNLERLSFQEMDIYYDLPWPFPDGHHDLGGTYSGLNTWNSETHKTAKIADFNLYSGQHPKVYVNTWNHVYGEDDNNSSMSDTRKSTISYTTGDRVKAEDDESSRNYTSETLEATP